MDSTQKDAPRHFSLHREHANIKASEWFDLLKGFQRGENKQTKKRMDPTHHYCDFSCSIWQVLSWPWIKENSASCFTNPFKSQNKF